MKWIKREKIENYSKTGTKSIKPPKEETDEQRNERQFFTYEIIKERADSGYISKALQQYPEMKEKYTKYA